MKRYLTPLAFLAFLASTFAASAGNLAPALSEPPVMRPVALSCAPYLVEGTNYFNFHAGCTPAGNEKGDDERDGFGAGADIGQPSEDECSYNGKH